MVAWEEDAPKGLPRLDFVLSLSIAQAFDSISREAILRVINTVAGNFSLPDKPAGVFLSDFRMFIEAIGGRKSFFASRTFIGHIVLALMHGLDMSPTVRSMVRAQ